MKRAVSLCLAAGLAMSCMWGCKDKKKDSSSVNEESAAEAVMVPLEMPEIDIAVPDSYELTSTAHNNSVYVKNDASVIVNSDVFTEEYKTLNEYVDFAKQTYEEYTFDVEYLSEERVSDSETVIEYIYSLSGENGIFRKYCMVGFFTDGEKLYLVTCKADEDTYEDYRQEFLDIIGSVAV